MRNRNHRDVEFRCEHLQDARYIRTFVLTSSRVRIDTNEMNTVNHHELGTVFTDRPSRFGNYGRQ